MSHKITTRDGRPAFIGTAQDLTLINDWARAVCHLAFGPVKGEAHYRKLPAKTVLSMWATEARALGET